MAKYVPTQVNAVYSGDRRTVAAEAQRKKPVNAQEVVAKNTVRTHVIPQGESKPSK